MIPCLRPDGPGCPTANVNECVRLLVRDRQVYFLKRRRWKIEKRGAGFVARLLLIVELARLQSKGMSSITEDMMQHNSVFA